MRKLAEPAKCGATGTAGADYLIARVLDDTLGVKINSITGYAGGSEIDMAVEKGEVLCRGMTIAPHFGREPFDQLAQERFRSTYRPNLGKARFAHRRSADALRNLR